MDGEFEVGFILALLICAVVWCFLPVDCRVTANEYAVATQQCAPHGGVNVLYRHNYLDKNSTVVCMDDVKVEFNAHQGGL